MESLLHYTWKHRLFPLGPLLTTDGRRVEVISVGRHNNDAGPDFLDARLRIADTVWAGTVEIHERSSDWFRHHHHTDAAYNGVILHVAEVVDADVVTADGNHPPQLQLAVPPVVAENYETLSKSDKHPHCRDILQSVPKLKVTSWLSVLSVERLEQRTRQIMERREQCGMDWETTAFVTLARTFGFGKNSDTFERWALAIPQSAIAKHRDDLFQIEAIFFGMAGLLADEGTDTDYYLRLRNEWNYLRRKFSLNAIDPTPWRMLRMRPHNFPYTRIAQLAMTYHEGSLTLARMLNTPTLDAVYQLLNTSVSSFWQTHYTFTSPPSARRGGALSPASRQSVVINCIIPLLFAYGRYKGDEGLCERALTLLDQLPPESNSIVRQWQQAGTDIHSAADTQALYLLTTRYCEAKDCLRCRFGYEYMRQNPHFLKEDDDNTFINPSE